MASLTPGASAKTAPRRILFKLNGKRPTLRLPAMGWSKAVGIKHRVEQLVACKITNEAPEPQTAHWLAAIDDVLFDRLAAVGLVESRGRALLGDYLDSYIESRNDVQDSTKRKWNSTHLSLLNHFGRDKPLRSITIADAEEWRRNLGVPTEAEKKAREKAKKPPKLSLSENTRRKHTAVAKVFFNAAVKMRLLESNPFADLKATIVPNPTRFRFIQADDAQQIIDACPDAEWRLIFALSRYGGLRCPSEHLALRWADVDWERSRFRVRSPKTAHHVGKDSRVVPLFPELLPYMEDAFQQAAEGAEFVITRYRDKNCNLRTQLHRIIERAGLEPWPKLFQNLRSTRQTELQENYPSHVVCGWLGNSEQVAKLHYLQTTEEHFADAVASKDEDEARRKIRRTHCDAQQSTTNTNPKKAVLCNVVQGPASVHMTPTGLEPVLPA